MSAAGKTAPDWDHLFELAVGQEGHFTTRQASEAGYSSQLLLKYLRNGRVDRIRRGVYRMVHYPASDNEDLVVLWLWSEGQGVISHESALMLHDLSDVLAKKGSLTVPIAWKQRRLRVPKAVSLYYADLGKAERTTVGAIPLTSVRRTISDCIAASVAPEFITAAIRRALRRNLITKAEATALRRKLKDE